MTWPIFAGIPEDDVREVLATARPRRFDRGQVVFHRDDPADTVHLIQAGRFAVRITTPRGESAVLHVLGPGEFFGEVALLDPGGVRSATVSAVENGRTLSIHRLDFDRLRRERPAVDQVVIAVLSGQVRRLSDRLVEALYVPVEERVRRRLHGLLELYGEDDPVSVPFTQAELAELAGTSRQMVNRVLRGDEEAGILELARGRIIVRDRVALAQRGRVGR